MQLGLIGLDNKGVNLALNFKRLGHDVIGYDMHEKGVHAVQDHGIKTVVSLKDLAESLSTKRIIWLMIPADEVIDQTLSSLKHYLSVSDIIIDGGNSFYKDSIRRAADLEALQLDYLDCGLSGRMDGEICAMIGGNRFAFNYCERLFESIAKKDGYLHCGKSGSGHFVRMIQHEIQSGMMKVLAEGFETMHKSEYNINLAIVANLWNHGTMVKGALLELTHHALAKDSTLESIKGMMESLSVKQ